MTEDVVEAVDITAWNRRVDLTNDIMSSLQVGRVFKDKAARVNGLDWDEEGEALIASADDESVHLYTLTKGDVYKTLHSKKYGVDMIKFVHEGPRVCVCASRASQGSDYAIRLWDLIENRYIRYFPVEAQVCRGNGLSVHPRSDLMLASCVDASVKLFSFSQESPLMTIPSFTSQPKAVFDCEGAAFACYLGRQKLYLFDCSHYSAGEFLTIELKNKTLFDEEDVENIIFSPDNQCVLISTSRGRLVAIDASTGEVANEYRFSNFGEGSLVGIPSYSPDGKFVCCGGTDNHLYIWNRITAECVNRLSGHAGVPLFCMSNPTKVAIASACLNVILWQPPPDSEQ